MQKNSEFCIKYERNDKKKKEKEGATTVAPVTERVNAVLIIYLIFTPF